MAKDTKKWLLTDNPAIIFEDNSVGRLKKEIWDMSMDQIDKVLENYGIPSESELGKAGSYIQNTPRHKAIELWNMAHIEGVIDVNEGSGLGRSIF